MYASAALCSVLLCICDYSDLLVILIFFESPSAAKSNMFEEGKKQFHLLLFVSTEFPMTAWENILFWKRIHTYVIE